MLSYIGKRILMFIPTIIIISFLIFFIIQLPPGDYVTSYVAAMSAEGEIFTLEQIEDLRKQFGLDDPWLVQYFNWIKGIITEGERHNKVIDIWTQTSNTVAEELFQRLESASRKGEVALSDEIVNVTIDESNFEDL